MGPGLRVPRMNWILDPIIPSITSYTVQYPSANMSMGGAAIGSYATSGMKPMLMR